MIKHIRIDNRLIHGQVAATWKSNIGADAIIVCNDKVASDPIQKMVLPMNMDNLHYLCSFATVISDILKK